jgi:invasion protein IalB
MSNSPTIRGFVGLHDNRGGGPMRVARSCRLGLPAALTVMLVCVAQLSGTSRAVAQGGQPTLLGQYADWGAYTASPGGKKVCFAISKPKVSKTEPVGRKRDGAYLFISTRPSENVRNEVSLIVGYPFKPSSDATAEIGDAKFGMYTQNDGAWIKNVAEEARLLETMRKGQDMTVKGMSSRGTQSTDQFSLRGLTQALDRAGQECR